MEDSQEFAVSEALERVEGDVEFLEELVTIFFEGFEDERKALRNAIDEKDGEALEGVAHSMKSALANLGAKSSSEICRCLEKQGRERDFNGVESRMLDLDREVAKYRERCRQFLNKADL